MMCERVNLEAVEEQFTRALENVGTIGKDAIKAGIPLITECRDNRQKVEALTLERDDARTAYRDMKAVLRLTVDERDTAQAALPSDEPEAVAKVKCPGSPCFGGVIRCGKEGEYFEDCPTCKGEGVVALKGDDDA